MLLSVLVGPAEAAEPALPWAVANHAHRQALLHRSWPDDGVPGSILVTARTPEVAAAVAAAEDGLVLSDRVVLLRVDAGTEPEVAGRVAAVHGVLGVEPDRLRDVAVVPDDDLYASEQWAHRLVNAETAWNTTTGDPSIQVAVLDTGVDGDHDDLIGNLVEQVDLSSGRVVTRTIGTDNDTCNVGHGTFVAGVVGALGNNGLGVAGVAWDVSLVDVALTSPASRCGILDSAIVAGLAHVTDPDRAGGPVDVVNLSLGAVSGACPIALQTGFDDARAGGTLVVAAAGNDQLRITGASSIPASCNGVMSVAAVGEDARVARYSNTNMWIDVAAPGGDTTTGDGIWSTTAGGGYGDAEGTSFAAPYVAGVAALMRSVDPTLTPDDLESILERTASHGGAGRDDEIGWGVIDAAGAVAAAVAGERLAPQEDPDFPVSTGRLNVERVKGASSVTEPVPQAVAMSERVFQDDQAIHAVVARSDDYADALAGSALGFGIGPLLFARDTGALSSATASELQRVLPAGSTVYLLGGTAALPPTLEAEVVALGLEPVRIAGTTRERTAVAVAAELERLLAEYEFQTPDLAIVATARNWPDAVGAGSLAAWFGIPILLTPATSLDVSVRDFLAARDWERVYVIGGTAAISDDVRRAVRDAARVGSRDAVRLAGADRSATTVAVGAEFEEIFSDQFEAAFGQPAVPNVVAAVNLRRDDAYAHVLSASALVGSLAGVFAPIEGESGDRITPEAQAYLCRFPADGVAVGGVDVVASATATLLDELLKGDAPACRL